jgi:transposase
MSFRLQQRSVIRYFVLCGKSNHQIAAKLATGYGLDALCLTAVQKWAARFRAGQYNIEDDNRSGRPPQTDLCDAVLRFLEKKRTSHREMLARRALPKKQQFPKYSLASG